MWHLAGMDWDRYLGCTATQRAIFHVELSSLIDEVDEGVPSQPRKWK